MAAEDRRWGIPQRRSRNCECCGELFNFGANQPDRRFCSKGCATRSRYKSRGVVIHDRRGYQRGCRCSSCVEANRVYLRDWEHKRKTKTDGVVHGTPGGYRRGCRCDDCSTARQLYRRFAMPLSLQDQRMGKTLGSTVVAFVNDNEHVIEWLDPTAEEALDRCSYLDWELTP